MGIYSLFDDDIYYVEYHNPTVNANVHPQQLIQNNCIMFHDSFIMRTFSQVIEMLSQAMQLLYFQQLKENPKLEFFTAPIYFRDPMLFFQFATLLNQRTKIESTLKRYTSGDLICIVSTKTTQAANYSVYVTFKFARNFNRCYYLGYQQMKAADINLDIAKKEQMQLPQLHDMLKSIIQQCVIQKRQFISVHYDDLLIPYETVQTYFQQNDVNDLVKQFSATQAGCLINIYPRTDYFTLFLFEVNNPNYLDHQKQGIVEKMAACMDFRTLLFAEFQLLPSELNFLTTFVNFQLRIQKKQYFIQITPQAVDNFARVSTITGIVIPQTDPRYGDYNSYLDKFIAFLSEVAGRQPEPGISNVTDIDLPEATFIKGKPYDASEICEGELNDDGYVPTKSGDGGKKFHVVKKRRRVAKMPNLLDDVLLNQNSVLTDRDLEDSTQQVIDLYMSIPQPEIQIELFGGQIAALVKYQNIDQDQKLLAADAIVSQVKSQLKHGDTVTKNGTVLLIKKRNKMSKTEATEMMSLLVDDEGIENGARMLK